MRWWRPTALLGAALLAGLAATPAQAAAPRSPGPPPQLLVRAGISDVVYVVAGCMAWECRQSMWRADGDGTSLVKVALPPGAGAPTGSLQALAFANPSDGLAVVVATTGGPATLWRTTDGALRWAKVPIGVNRSVLTLAASPTSFDLVTATCPGVNRTCHGVRFQRGDATAASFALTSVALANQAGLADFGASVASFGPVVWIAEARADGAPALAVSTDGGRSLALRADPSLVAVDTCGLTATSMRSVWAQCPTGMLVSFFHSTDGGATWGAVRLAPQVAGTDGHAFDPVAGDLAYAHLTFPGPALLAVTGARSAVARVAAGPFRQAWMLAFVNRVDGIGIGASVNGGAARLAATTDGGARWRAVALP